MTREELESLGAAIGGPGRVMTKRELGAYQDIVEGQVWKSETTLGANIVSALMLEAVKLLFEINEKLVKMLPGEKN